jgi:hypothetical protein
MGCPTKIVLPSEEEIASLLKVGLVPSPDFSGDINKRCASPAVRQCLHDPGVEVGP